MKAARFLVMDTFMLFLVFKVKNMNTAGIIRLCDIDNRIRRENTKKQ